MSYDVTFADLQAQPLAVVDLDVVGPQDIPALFGPAFAEVTRVCAVQGVALVGPPIAHYRTTPGSWRVAVGFPVTRTVRAEGRVTSVARPGQRYAVVTHTGSYDGIVDACTAVRDYAVDNGFETDDDWWERYLDGPGTPEPRTEVLVACRRVRPHAVPSPERA